MHFQDECREHVGQEEDKMRKELQHALTQESSVCHDQLQQALRHHVCQEEYADAAAHQEMEQLKQLISQQAEAMKRFESQSQQYVTQQHDEWTQKQHTQFQKFDGVIRDKDEVIQSLRQELANNKEHHLQELDQALRDAERRAQQSTPVFAGTSTQPYATPVEKKTLTAVAAVAHAEPVPAFHSPGLSLGASAGNVNLKSKNKGSSTMVVPVRRRLRTKTPPAAAAQRVPSMGLVCEGECVLKDLLHQHIPSFQYHLAQEEYQAQTIQEEVLHQMIQVYQVLVIVQHSRQVFQFAMEKVHQTMEEMEVTQEETQRMMAMRPPGSDFRPTR